ncbi:hypothetical protein EZV73_04915 [Acidaminobacter sp. JC074]|uniref:hypothetical protein n=1 Tax=Acidaminobacter sp. JC074 TaxID=2530199 RepID=UPI001F0F255E|nr:hypothetical protein [Acidaminobacter sp. JC074]MCH4886895.1 hypothetical protein [Acidaminobacter sp. JC074]
MIKKMILLLLLLMLVGCTNDITGTWIDKNGLVEMTFEDEKVVFFGVEGTYKAGASKIEMTLGTEVVKFKYKLEDDKLILFLEDSDLVLERLSQ